MNPHDDHWDEQRLAQLLASLSNDAAPPDRPFLARLRDLNHITAHVLLDEIHGPPLHQYFAAVHNHEPVAQP